MTSSIEVRLRILTGEAEEMRALQQVIEDAPRYAHLMPGVPAGPADAQSLYTILPEGKSYDDKFVLGIYSGASMVGCADLIRGYPDLSTAYVGLLLIAEQHEGKGIGSAAFRELERLALSWRTCSCLRLGIARTNERAFRFWSKFGFAPTGEVKPYRYGAVVSETVLFAKALS